MGEYKDNLQIEESDQCTVVLRSGHKLAGHMRAWDKFYKPPAGAKAGEFDPVMVWCLVTAGPEGKGRRFLTWTRNGCFRLSGAASRYDITDFQIGRPPT